MKAFLEEFKKFALRGNVMDMAVGIIVGAAFTAIVTSLVDDLLSPLLGLLVRVNFSDLKVSVLGATFAYGNFIMAVINFLLVAFVLFLIIRAMNRISSLGKRKRKQNLLPRNVRFVKAKLQSRLRDVPTVHHTLKKRSRYEPV